MYKGSIETKYFSARSQADSQAQSQKQGVARIARIKRLQRKESGTNRLSSLDLARHCPLRHDEKALDWLYHDLHRARRRDALGPATTCDLLFQNPQASC